MLDSKCYFVQLVTLYSKRVLYGYRCDMDALWRNIQDFDRMITLEDYVSQCNLRGDIIDELNKLKSKLAKNYNLVCRTCD